jgi:hypothetical protein
MDKFDTLALGRIKADNINIRFYEGSTLVYELLNYEIDNRRDIRGESADYPTTTVIYCVHENPQILTTVLPAGSKVEVELLGADIFIGTLQLGLAIPLGVTDFSFTTKFQDFSPVEKVFNVIRYVEGLKVKDYIGSFRFWTTEFDIHDRFFVSAGGKLLIINGSDTTNNCEVNSQDRFACTALLGRIKSMPLKTIKEDDRLGVLAQASFEIREIV